MVGDIKGAFLSDTDTTNATDSNVVTNGTFDSNTNSWSGDSGASISWDSGGFASVGNGGGDNTYAIQQTGILVSGAKYRITGRVQPSMSGSYEFRVRAGGASTQWNITSGLTNGQWYSFDTGIITADGTKLEIGSFGGTITNFYLDDVYVWKLEEEDRSVNNTGLEVHGTITKSAVATGAELVAYSGYSASNYLVQPSISGPGTGDFSVSAWIKPGRADGTGGNYFHLFSLGTSSTGGQSRSTGFVLKFTTYSGANSSGFVPYLYNNDGGTNHGTYDANNFLPLGAWGQIVAVRRNGVSYIYLNGRLVKTGNSWTTNLTDTYLTVFLGLSHTNERGGEAEVSLLRYSLSAPSSEQVKKIYEDEKMLFQENAACTIYGSSGGVDGLAYDEVTEQLHVGTSSGRSDFQGLRRINNTTTAVTTAISAHDGFIIEQ